MNVTKKTLIAAASLLLMFGSASSVAEVAAAAPHKSSQTQAASNETRLEQQKKAAMAIHSKQKKPGDLTVMYDGTDNSLSFNYLSIKTSNDDEYTKLLSKYKAPGLTQPAWLPEGYAFQSGEIMPPYPHFLSKRYQGMLKELQMEAKGKTYYTKKPNWSEAGETAIVFSKDSDVIRLSAKRMQPFITEVTKVPGKGETFEKLTVNGIEALYATNSDALFSTRLMWENTKDQLEYEISTYKNSPLTKDDLVAIAESMVKE